MSTKNVYIVGGVAAVIVIGGLVFFAGARWKSGPVVQNATATTTSTVEFQSVEMPATQAQSISQLTGNTDYSANGFPGSAMTAAQETNYATYVFNNLSDGDVSSADCTNLENGYEYPIDSQYFGEPGGISQGDGLYIYSKQRCLGYVATYYELGGGTLNTAIYQEQIIDLATNSTIEDCLFQQSLPADSSVTYEKLDPDNAAEAAFQQGTTYNCSDSAGFNWQQVAEIPTPLTTMWNKFQQLNGY